MALGRLGDTRTRSRAHGLAPEMSGCMSGCHRFVSKRDCRNECLALSRASLAQEMSGCHRFVNKLDKRDCRNECLAQEMSGCHRFVNKRDCRKRSERSERPQSMFTLQFHFHGLEIPTRMTPKWCYMTLQTSLPDPVTSLTHGLEFRA